MSLRDDVCEVPFDERVCDNRFNTTQHAASRHQCNPRLEETKSMGRECRR